MKRLGVSKLHEKVVLAAIILSCGLVLQAEPKAGGRDKSQTQVHVKPPVTHTAGKAHHIQEARASRVQYHELVR